VRHDSTYTFQSVQYPDVIITVKKSSKARRIELDMRLAKLRAEHSAISSERLPLQPELDEAKKLNRERPCSCQHDQADHDHDWFFCRRTDCDCRRIEFPSELSDKLNDIFVREQAVIFDKIYPEIVRWGVVKIVGLELMRDDEPLECTADNLITDGPEELVNEIAIKIESSLTLSEPERKNSERRTTSGGPADGSTPNTIAPDAGQNGSIVSPLVTDPPGEIASDSRT